MNDAKPVFYGNHGLKSHIISGTERELTNDAMQIEGRWGFSSPELKAQR